jgi:hypothetical protein
MPNVRIPTPRRRPLCLICCTNSEGLQRSASLRVPGDRLSPPAARAGVAIPHHPARGRSWRGCATQCPWTMRGRGRSHRAGHHCSRRASSVTRAPRAPRSSSARHDLAKRAAARWPTPDLFMPAFPIATLAPGYVKELRKDREGAPNGGGEATGGTAATGQPAWARARRAMRRVPATQRQGAPEPEDRQAGVRHVFRSRAHAPGCMRRLRTAQAAPGARALLCLLQAPVALAPARGERAPRTPHRPRTVDALSGDQRQRQSRTL